jgi:hypothetical protein
VDEAIAEELRRLLPARDPAPAKPKLAGWATVAGVIANVVLLVTFFLNWSWERQLGSVLPFGLVWLAGWWRWQGALARYENAELAVTIRREGEAAAKLAELIATRPVPDAAAERDFELRYAERRALERRAAAEAELTRQQEWERMGVLERWRAQRGERAG